ncbi:Sucrase-isomaltase, intestinal [Chionoecetes opilio]|uniref:Sucrase-isomaltase, intestinal n=1 Tax=Chionoecetes opilio TaxID=41210 RepID=A0A8J4Y8R9_CHIOP|nr:Sucrase-isomaltase, intestinal [Chionoecetes opilio]
MGGLGRKVVVVMVIGVMVVTVMLGAGCGAVTIDRSSATCLAAETVSQEECEAVGCIWDPWGDEVPMCFFPPASRHGYTVTTVEDSSSSPGVTAAYLELKNTSAHIAPDLKTSLKVEVTQYSAEVLRVKVTVPGEDRYEPPVPLQLPDPSTQESLYHVYLGEEGEDFSLVIRRNDSSVVIGLRDFVLKQRSGRGEDVIGDRTSLPRSPERT